MSRLAAAATIRRAAAAARRELNAMRAQRVRWLEQQYAAIADFMRRALRRSASNGTVPISALGALRAQAQTASNLLGSQLETELARAFDEAIRIGGAGVGAAISDSARAVATARTLDILRAFVGADGLQLSDRIWRVRDGTRQVIISALNEAITQGWSGIEAAQRLIGQGLAVTPEIRRAMAAAGLDSLNELMTRVLLTGVGNPLHNARRLMQTEINRAYTASYHESLREHPDIAGVRYLLSPRHPRVDICFRAGTEIATQRGRVPIEDVVIGDLVLTHLNRWKPVTRLYRSWTEGKLVALHCPMASSHSQPVVMTPNHPVLTAQGWRPANDLKTGDRAAVFFPWLRCCESTRELCGARTASPSFQQSEQDAEGERAEAVQYGAGQRQSYRTMHNAARGFGVPSSARMTGVGIAQRLLCLLANWGFLRGGDHLTNEAATLPAFATCQGAACQSSDWIHLRLAGNATNSSGLTSDSSWKQMSSHTLRRFAAWWREQFGSTQRHKRTARSFESSTPEHGSLNRMPHTAELPVVSYIDYGVMSVGEMYSPGETVFNLEVEDDHSYVAGGIVVHNCDMHAAVNLHALGPGVYPLDDVPYPAHPQTLSYTVAVFKDEISDEDRAGQQSRSQWLQTQSPAVQAAILGKAKAAAFRAGQVPEFGLRTPWRVLRARLQARGVDVEGFETAPPPSAPARRSDGLAPVSEAFAVNAHRRRVRDALGVIDAVHTDGDLPRIPIENTAAALGLYARAGREAVRVAVQRSDVLEFALFHEIGHFLDHQALGVAGAYASETHADLRAWRAAMEGSAAFARWRSLQAAARIAGDDNVEEYTSYLLLTRELWARSYAQYIVLRSGRADLAAQLSRMASMHWTAEDFAPIAEQIERLFRLRGWQ